MPDADVTAPSISEVLPATRAIEPVSLVAESSMTARVVLVMLLMAMVKPPSSIFPPSRRGIRSVRVNEPIRFSMTRFSAASSEKNLNGGCPHRTTVSRASALV